MAISRNTAYDNEDHEFMDRIRKRILKYSIIKELFYRIIYPMLKHKPQRVSADAWLEALWDTEAYPIEQYRASEELFIHGAKWITPFRKTENTNKYKVLPSDLLVARFDIKKMTVDVEIISKKSSCILTVSPVDWRQVKNRLREINHE